MASHFDFSEPVQIEIVRLDPELPLPRQAHASDAGYDLATRVDLTLAPGQRQLVPTGVAMAIPDGWAGFVHPRSGLAARSGVTIVNAPGTLDAGYRGEIKVCLLNTDAVTPVVLHRGDLIAQLVVQRVASVTWREVDALAPSSRGTGGHGSSGGVASWNHDSGAE